MMARSLVVEDNAHVERCYTAFLGRGQAQIPRNGYRGGNAASA